MNNYFIYCPLCATRLERKLINDEDVQGCPSCGYNYWNNPTPVTSILLHKDKSVLLLQRSSKPYKHFWVLPGGFLKFNETPQEAICRETKEEIGIVPKLKRIIGIYQIDVNPKGFEIDIIYEGIFSGEVKLSNEHTQYNFFPITALPDKIAYKHREAIEDWKKNFKNKSV